MIARVWEGAVPLEKAHDYERYLAGFGVDDYLKVPGNRGITLLRRDVAGEARFLLVSLWESRDVLVAYAGADIDKAHYYQYDLECLVNPSPTVQHYEVVATAAPPGA